MRQKMWNAQFKKRLLEMKKNGCISKKQLGYRTERRSNMKKVLCVLMLMFLLVVAIVPAIASSGEQTEKKTEALIEALGDLSNEEDLTVYVAIMDIDHNMVMNRFAELYPEEYAEYCFAKESDIECETRQAVFGDFDQKDTYLDNPDPVDGELLQRAIEIKRMLSSEAYLEHNSNFINKYVDKEKQSFISQYSPLMIVTMTKADILMIEKENMVAFIDLFVEGACEDELAIANQISEAAYIRDTLGCTGSGVKIGQIESGVPKLNVSDLNNATITRHTTYYTDHATLVARILVGNSNGIAPDATLYSTGYSGTSEFYTNVEWLISQGVNVINMSNTLGLTDGVYSTPEKWVDHIAMQHDIHFVKSAGNSGGNITCPGMAYNAITVGGFNDHNTTNHIYHEMCSWSSYEESSSSSRPEKPNVIASACNINIDGNHDGTSFAAPQVTGAIAQLCGYKASLKTKQSVVGAMLAAGSVYKIDGSAGTGVYGDSFSNSARITNSVQISDKEGAGKFNVRNSRNIARSGNYWREKIDASSFPFTETVTIDQSSNSLIRIAIFWMKKNSISTSSHTPGTITETTFTNLNLYVYAPDGSLVGSSWTTNSNYEIVQFIPQQTGTYTIKITRTGSSTSTQETVGIAVW